MVPVLVRRHDALQAAATGVDECEEPLGVVRGVDEQLPARGPAGDEVAVVVHRRHADLADDGFGQLPDVGGSPHRHLAGVRHSGSSQARPPGGGVPWPRPYRRATIAPGAVVAAVDASFRLRMRTGPWSV